MPRLKYQDHAIATRDGENVLDALLRHGVSIPFSCRNGVCHVCLQRCLHGTVPAEAQRGLQPELIEQGHFLPCKCVPQEDMEIAPPAGLYAATLVHGKEMLSPDVCRLLLEPVADGQYRAGQFINLRRADGVTRSYSLAGDPAEDYFLELHVQRKDGGTMSNWILDELAPGDELAVQGPNGDCCYRDAAHDSPLLLAGAGTGVAPLSGIVHDALRSGHRKDIHLYHGGRTNDSFYLREALRQLERRHDNFHYHECVSADQPQMPDGHAGRAHEVAVSQHPDLRGWHVYLAGPPEMVDDGALLAAAHGATPEAIHTDAFALRDLRSSSRDASPAAAPAAETDEARYPPPDRELWTALGEGSLLMEVLEDFYARVFEDERLSSFFHGVTKQRSIEKQYLFLRQILTGEKIYFGERPRNAHHWMVISDELFDYRESIMLTCLRKHGLTEPMVQRFRAIEGFYRQDIVKSAPVPRIVGGVALPLEGFEELVMDVGTLCDTCGREIEAGETVIYHVRIGKVHCSDCSARQRKAAA